MPRTVALVCAALLLLAAAPARAHHGDADRYNQEVITVTGTVVEVQMVNPHVHIVFDVVEDENWGHAGKLVAETRQIARD